MNIYKLTNDVVTGYDTYDSCIVVAQNEYLAATICPSGWYEWDGNQWMCHASAGRRDWCTPLEVTCEFIAELPDDSHYRDGDVILASFNAG